MAAVGTFSAIGVQRRVGKNGGIVLFRFGSRLIADGLIELLLSVIAAEDGADRRTGQCIVDALHGRQTDAERRALFIEQPPSGEALHDGDADVVLFTGAVEQRAVGVNAAQRGVVAVCKQGVDVLAGRKHVEGRIDAEQDHFHIAGQRCLPRDFRIVGAQADVADGAASFQLHHIIQIVRMLDLLPFLLGVHIVDHAEVDIIRLHPPEKILKGGLYIPHIACAEILSVLPCGADVALNDPMGAVFVNALADDIARLGVRHPAVQKVDALGCGVPDQLNALVLRMALQPFAAKADLAHKKSSFAKPACVHRRFLRKVLCI